MTVPHYHHQAIDRLAPALTITATADDGTIEAVELDSHPFTLAVQWHPEAATDCALFEALVSRLLTRGRAHSPRSRARQQPRHATRLADITVKTVRESVLAAGQGP